MKFGHNKFVIRLFWSTVCAVGLLIPHCSAQSYFSNRTSFTTGTNAVAAVAADFNGDGKLDLAVVNQGDKTVSILLGKPDSTFAPKVDYAVGTAPLAIVAADFNGDGKLDLAVVNQGDNTVSILLGKPDSTFAPKVDYAVGTAPLGIVAADFNGDSKVDLAIINSTSNTVSILMGNGDGTFAAQTIIPISGAPVGIVASDFNGDGKMDLAVASSALSEVDILLGNGNGTFTGSTPVAVNAPLSVASADFNGDGKLDLVTVNLGQVATVLLSKGDGTFSRIDTSFVLDSGPVTVSMAVGDFDGDGKVDLLVQAISQWKFLKGLGNGQFQVSSPFEFTPPGPATLGSTFIVADFNHDGSDDFASNNTIMLGSVSGVGFRAAPFPVRMSDRSSPPILTGMVSPISPTPA